MVVIVFLNLMILIMTIQIVVSDDARVVVVVVVVVVDDDNNSVIASSHATYDKCYDGQIDFLSNGNSNDILMDIDGDNVEKNINIVN